VRTTASAHWIFPVPLLLPLLLAAVAGLVGGCQRGRTGGAPDGGGACLDGQRRCQGNTWGVCEKGVIVPFTQCSKDEVCVDALGCAACTPGKTACEGDHIVACGADGKPTSTKVGECAPSVCVLAGGEATCAGPCDPAALAKSYTGCVYYAVDLPQWGLPVPGFGTIAAEQQFAIAVANPWDVPVDVLVERSDAPVGMPAQPAQVTKAQVAPRALQVIPLPQREVSGFVKGSARSRSLRTANAYPA